MYISLYIFNRFLYVFYYNCSSFQSSSHVIIVIFYLIFTEIVIYHVHFEFDVCLQWSFKGIFSRQMFGFIIIHKAKVGTYHNVGRWIGSEVN